MKLGFSQQEIINTAKSLGLPSDGFVQRRVARAIDILDSNKVSRIDDGIFRVSSQYDVAKSYIVNLNGDWEKMSAKPSSFCDCPDHQKHTGDSCKHMIASMIFATGGSFNDRRLWLSEVTNLPVRTSDNQADDHQKHEAKSLIIKDVTEYKKNVRRAWFIIDGKRRINLWQDLNGKLCCNCGAYYDGDCKHKKVIREYLSGRRRVNASHANNDGGNGSKITNECGSEKAKAIQEKLNGQLNSRQDNGNGATGGFVTADNHHKAPSQQPQLEIRNPFQECELKDIAQIEGRSNGELAWTLRNGETVISYAGVMALAEKHSIEFTVSHHEDTNTVIAYARRNENRSERVSGKPVRISGSIPTASELAKRNAARQLIPFAEIKVLELKAKLEADFDWQKAKAKCVELVATEANVDITIYHLVKVGKLRQENPSGYNRTEWLLIHKACQEDAQSNDNDGGDNSPPSSEARDPKSLNRWSVMGDAFIEKCREAIDKVREKKKVEANDQPISGGNGKRKLQMDSKLRTWLIETDGTKKSISCREICEKFESNIVTR